MMAIGFLLLFMGCKKNFKTLEDMISVGSEKDLKIRELNQIVDLEFNVYRLDVDSDGHHDLEFVAEEHRGGQRTRFYYLKVTPLHEDVQLATQWRTDTVYVDWENLGTISGVTPAVSTNCDGIGDLYQVHTPDFYLQAFEKNDRIYAFEQSWLNAEFRYAGSRLWTFIPNYRQDIEYSFVHLFQGPSCGFFPQGKKIYMAFKLKDHRMGYVELIINNERSVYLHRLAIQYF
jgi:hypothetical protein